MQFCGTELHQSCPSHANDSGIIADGTFPLNPAFLRQSACLPSHTSLPIFTGLVLCQWQSYACRCGPIKRATVVKNQATGQPLGLAHVEFETQAAALGAPLIVRLTCCSSSPSL